MRIVALSLLFAAAAVAQPAEPPKKARVEGSVVSLTGEAIPRATVRLLGGPATTTTADDAGKFFFENITPGSNYRIDAQRPGYITAQYGARSATGPATPLTLAEGQVLKGLTITMTPQGIISGKITDKDNDPVAGAVVSAVRVAYRGGVLVSCL